MFWLDKYFCLQCVKDNLIYAGGFQWERMFNSTIMLHVCYNGYKGRFAGTHRVSTVQGMASCFGLNIQMYHRFLHLVFGSSKWHYFGRL